MKIHLSLRAAALCPLAILAHQPAAQCANVWTPGKGMSGVHGNVYATINWDPDGFGPATPVLVLAGTISVAGDVPVTNIATWNPSTGAYGTLGNGLGSLAITDVVQELAVGPNNELYAGGRFAASGSTALNSIARWNGAAWVPLGSGLGSGSWVGALTVAANGDLIVGGQFTSAGGVAATNIARWNGSSWAPVGSGTGANGSVVALRLRPNGRLVMGGGFTAVDGVPANNIAEWTGSTWIPLQSGTSGSVLALENAANGDLVVGGTFASAGGIQVGRIAVWNGAWSSLGGGRPFDVVSLYRLSNNQILVGGSEFQPVGRVSRWDGTAWIDTGTCSGRVYSVNQLATGEVVAAGTFQSINSNRVNNVARWNGTTWSATTLGTDGPIYGITTLANGDVIAVGSFQHIGGVAANRVARRSGSMWSPLGAGLNGAAKAVGVMANGNIVVGGLFNQAGSVPASGLAQWNGTAWSSFGGSLLWNNIFAFANMPNGDLIVAGEFVASGATHIGRWNGTAWQSLGGIPNGTVYAVTVLPNGDLVLGGAFTSINMSGTVVAASRIATWSNGVFSPLSGGAPNGQVIALAVNAAGALIVGGSFTAVGSVAANRVAMWNGAWTAMGAGLGTEPRLAIHPNGQVIAGAAGRCWRWDGTSWQALATPFTGPEFVSYWPYYYATGTLWQPFGPAVDSLAIAANGDVLVGGYFAGTGTTVCSFFAQCTTTCPASTITYGSGCSSSIGAVETAATTQPWLGGRFRATTTGIPANSLAIGARGLSRTSIPLSSVWGSAAAPGCTILSSAELLDLILPANGIALTDFGIPVDTSLLTAPIYYQVLPLTFDTTGALVEATASNGLRLTFGSF